ncbi:MAG: hypothetical protein LKK13_02270 [Bacilli bacterium]|nr:hypothetical protein [Bacilli bacterium]
MKHVRNVLALAAASLVALTVSGCGGTTDSDAIKAAIAECEGLSYSEILAKAQEEVGDNTMEVYGNSSNFALALAKFTEDTGIKVNNNKLGDAAMYEKLTYTIGNGKYVADMTLIQDGNKLQTQMLNPGYLYSYTPKDYKDKLAKEDLNPTGAVYLNKVFMYNNTNYDGTNQSTAVTGAVTNKLTNVWQLAGTSADANHIAGCSFKPGSQENVNLNFLAMLTSDEWCTKLATAYKDFYGTDYVAEEAYANIGYKWIGEFLQNVKDSNSWHSSDGTSVKDTAAGLSGNMDYANYNKLKDCTETGIGYKDTANLTICDFEGDGVDGFGGFLYKMYTLIPKNAKYPYAACALINYILSTEGFGAAWGGYVGYYSTNPDNAIASGDKALNWWKGNCVIEDPEYVSNVYLDVYDYVTSFES